MTPTLSCQTHTQTHTLQSAFYLVGCRFLFSSYLYSPAACLQGLKNLLIRNAQVLRAPSTPIMSETDARASVEAADHNSVHNDSDKNK